MIFMPRWAKATATAMVGLPLLALAAGCGNADRQGAKAAEAPPGLRVEIVKPQLAVRKTVQPAQVEAFERVEIVAKIPGYLDTFGEDRYRMEQDRAAGKEVKEPYLIDTGSRVKKGWVLAILRQPEMEKDLKLKEAALKQAGAEVKKAQADLDLSEAEFKRHEKLFNDKSINQSQLDEKRFARDAAKAGVEVAEAKVEVAQSEKEHTQELLNYATLKAPFDGVVTRRWVDTGAYVQPASESRRASILSLMRTDPVRVVVDVPESVVPWVNLGDKAELQATCLGQKLTGTISRTSAAVDPGTRTMRVEIDLPNADGKICPGTFGTATIILEERKGVFTVPAACLRLESSAAHVYCLVDGKAKKTPVTVSFSDGTTVEITSGLTADSQVIRVVQGTLTDGQPIEAK